jgi:hypothetical protein
MNSHAATMAKGEGRWPGYVVVERHRILPCRACRDARPTADTHADGPCERSALQRVGARRRHVVSTSGRADGAHIRLSGRGDGTPRQAVPAASITPLSETWLRVLPAMAKSRVRRCAASWTDLHKVDA